MQKKKNRTLPQPLGRHITYHEQAAEFVSEDKGLIFSCTQVYSYKVQALNYKEQKHTMTKPSYVHRRQ